MLILYKVNIECYLFRHKIVEKVIIFGVKQQSLAHYEFDM
jgi:hypothetical protein